MLSRRAVVQPTLRRYSADMTLPADPLDGITARELVDRIIPGPRDLLPGMPTLPDRVDCEATRYPQQVLDAALSSIENMWRTMRLSRDLSRILAGRQRQGRLADEEVDLLRAIIVFSGAGLDATLKALIAETLPLLTEISDEADREFTTFVERELTDTKTLAAVLLDRDGDTRDRLLRRYVQKLTGDSLQSVAQVERVARALGISGEARLRSLLRRGTALHDMFSARNQIVHELDTTPRERHDRRYRNFKATVRLVHAALECSQLSINGVANQLNKMDQ